MCTLYSRIHHTLRLTLIVSVAALIAPLTLISLLFKYMLYGIALLTLVDWTEAEEVMLIRAYLRGATPESLKFILWRRPNEIRGKLG